MLCPQISMETFFRAVWWKGRGDWMAGRLEPHSLSLSSQLGNMKGIVLKHGFGFNFNSLHYLMCPNCGAFPKILLTPLYWTWQYYEACWETWNSTRWSDLSAAAFILAGLTFPLHSESVRGQRLEIYCSRFCWTNTWFVVALWRTLKPSYLPSSRST